MTLGVDRGLKIQLTDNTLENIKLDGASTWWSKSKSSIRFNAWYH